MKKRLLPAPLRPGDTVGLIAPGSPVPADKLANAWTNLESLGLKVRPGEYLEAHHGFLAGSDQNRIDDIHRMFSDPEIKAVWCVRGGYGCTRLLPHLDYRLIRRHPKILIGYSDITALLLAIYRQCGLVGFHGPVAVSEFTDYTRAQVEHVLFDGQGPMTISLASAYQEATNSLYQARVIHHGKASGSLIGGNLSLISSMVGTDYTWKVKDKLLFLEDIGEKPYRIDRMLTQLRQSCDLRQAAGIALGIFEGCEAKPGDNSLSLAEVLNDRLGDLGIPVMYGLSFGHIDHQCTLPIGIKTTLDTANATIQLEEDWLER